MRTRLSHWLHSVWKTVPNQGKEKWSLTLLTWLSLLYGKMVAYRNKKAVLKPKIVFHARLISIGNLTAGGTGKTPMVAWMAGYIQTKTTLPVGIVLRGYGRKINCKKPVLVNTDFSETGMELDYIGDEAKLLSDLCPHSRIMVCSDRAAAIARLEKEYHCEFIILDDAFQQLHLSKFMDIVCLDSQSPFGNGCLLPRGPLREPVSSLIRGTHFVFPKGKPRLRNENKIKDILGEEKSLKKMFYFSYEVAGAYVLNDPLHVVDVNQLKKERLGILSSIGSPESFSRTLESIGIQGPTQEFPDHFLYNEKTVSQIQDWVENERINGILTTEKDAVRLKGFLFPVPCYVIEMELFPPDEWIQEVKSLIHTLKNSV
jgi:tetraacyldisaccharide 4'-kinase